VGEPLVSFAGLLRKLRTDAGLTQEELAAAAGLSPRSISDLERGVNLTARKDTARMLADALRLTGAARTQFEAMARGQAIPGGVATASRTLPRDITSFTGREHELRALAEAAADSGAVVGIHAIGGMAGIGKTAFVVHAAHRLADRFPAGQIFLPLHGHTPGQQPVDPDDALASLLLTAGVPAAQIPPGLEARMALWRDRLAGQQLLLILDDAASSEQVRPLLPGAGGSLVLITSRRHLTALEDTTTISLDTLSADEAAALLVRLAARAGLSPDDPAVREIIRLCGYLPLAIGMVSRQLHHHPAWSLTARAAELSQAVDRLELMSTENLSVAAAFNLSYQDLAPEQQRLFRRLGLHPGSHVDAYAAAALDGTDVAAARRSLEILYDHYLLAEPAHGRYRLHDLLREHARALTERLDPAGDRDAVIARTLDYYQHAAAVADALLARQTRILPAAVPVAMAALTDREQALAWARAERANLLGCLDHVTAAGQRARVVALTAGVGSLLRHDGPWTEAIARHLTALAAAQELGDRFHQAHCLNELGALGQLTGDYQGAIRDLTAALGVYRDIGERLGQANSLSTLGDVRQATGGYPNAIADLEEALGIYRDLGERLGLANTLNSLGRARRAAGDFHGSARALEEALGIYRDLGHRLGQANALNALASARQLTGDSRGAISKLEEALGIFRDIGGRFGQANTLTTLGTARLAAADHAGAIRDLEAALAIYREVGSRVGESNAHIYLGSARRASGDLSGAAQDLAEALDIYRDVGDRGGEVEALNEIGTLHRVRGDLSRARSYHQDALDLARELGSAWDEAHALAGLARSAVVTGGDAEDLLRQALDIFQRIGATEAGDVAAELSALRAGSRPEPDSASPRRPSS
jgi:tetratricopeptide (TPR) repeat protein/transcriptional regulator with XRE-family HTH domain